MGFRSDSRNLKAIRHANGRDGWNPVREFTNSRWRAFLLDNWGVRFHYVSEDSALSEFPCRLAPYDCAKDHFTGMTGAHFYCPWKFYNDRPSEYQIHVCDFDGCAGTFEYASCYLNWKPSP